MTRMRNVSETSIFKRHRRGIRTSLTTRLRTGAPVPPPIVPIVSP